MITKTSFGLQYALLVSSQTLDVAATAKSLSVIGASLIAGTPYAIFYFL